MKEFKSLILSFCIASIVFGLIFMLTPSGKLQKNVRFNFAVIFLSILFFSVSSIFNIDFNFKKSEALSLSYTENIIKAQAEMVCHAALEENGYSAEEINIYTNKNEDGSISIKRIRAKTKDDTEKVKSAITAVIKTDSIEVRNE